MKRTADSSTTSEACPKSTSGGRRASGIASGSIHTAITRSTPRRYGNGGSGQSNKGSTLLFSKLYVSYSGILVLLADASMLNERAPPMQGVLISWMLRLFIHLLFVGPSRQSTRDGSMSFWRYSGVSLRSLMVQRITGLRLFGRGPSEKRLGCRCTLTWYKKRIRRELLSR